MIEKLILHASETDIPAGVRTIDRVASMLQELYFLEHPAVPKTDKTAQKKAAAYAEEAQADSVWAYYPWRACSVRIPPEETYFRLRTARNRIIITEKEQQAYRTARVGIAGLSVGSALLRTLVATGGPKRLRLADPDTIELTNLNRIAASLPDIGEMKTEVAARMVWDLDPFAELDLWERGVEKGREPSFVESLTVVADEMDDIGAKIRIREAARAARVPVVMATDNGDGAIVDVERFDEEPERPLFHGRVQLPEDVGDVLTREEFVRLSSEIIDPALFTKGQRDSVAEVGKTLSGVGQTATAATVAGAAAAYAMRLIAAKRPLSSGRYLLNTEEAFLRPISS